ncbi:MAG: response regulator [Holophaga sp.]|nr:response regulator [Holophaga sp.]
MTMALLGLFKPKDEIAGEPVLKDRSMILAYLEELARLGANVQFWVHKDDFVPLSGKIDLLHEQDSTMTVLLQRALPGDLQPNSILDMVFSMDGMRFDTPVHFIERAGYLRALFTLPKQISHAERRAKMRARFGPREKATCTVLEGFFEGKGATGRLVNLSMEGLCIRIDRAITIGNDHKLAINPDLFTVGTALPVVRIQNLPHTPTIECCGVVSHMRISPIGVLLGLRLEGLGGLETQLLHAVMTRRLPSFARGFPVKHRRAAMELGTGAELQAPEETWEIPEELEPTTALDATTQTACDEDLLAARPDTRERLLQIKKRGKRILIIIRDDLDRAILAGTLHVDGFRQILEAQNFIEVVKLCRTTPPHLILIEQQVGTANAQEFVSKVKKASGCGSIPVVMITDTLDVRTTLMAKAAGFAHMQRKPVDYDGELKAVLYRLLELA